MNRTQAISHMLSGGKVKLDKSTYMYYDNRCNLTTGFIDGEWELL